MHPGYRGLVTLAERELELVRDGEIDELGALWEERRRLVGDLPAIPPPSALGWLEQAAALQGRTTALLEERTEKELATVQEPHHQPGQRPSGGLRTIGPGPRTERADCPHGLPFLDRRGSPRSPDAVRAYTRAGELAQSR